MPFCWAPLVVVLDQAAAYESVGLGLLHGTVLNAAAFSWLLGGLVKVGGTSSPAAVAIFILFALVQGGRTALLAACVVASRRARLSAALVFPLALVATDFLYPYVFPWQTAIFTVPVPAWMQLAEFGGPLALSFWVGSVNALFAAAWMHGSGERSARLRCLVAGFALLAVVTFVGRYLIRSRSAEAAAAPTARVAVIQGNTGAKSLHAVDPIALYRDQTLKLLARDGSIDWIVWPETALPVPTLNANLRPTLRDYVFHDDSRGLGDTHISKPLLLGMVIEADGTERRGPQPALPRNALTNSAILSDTLGHIIGRYDKHELVPFGEQDALSSLPIVSDALRAVTRFSRGPRRAPIVFRGYTLGVSICYEDILRESFRESILDARPDLLVNITSDAWFAGSAAPDLHLALAILRAVEHRRYLLRATNTGISAAVAPTGEVVWRLPEDQVATGVVSVRYLRADTLYERWGDLPWTILVISGALVVAFRYLAGYAVDRSTSPRAPQAHSRRERRPRRT